MRIPALLLWLTVLWIGLWGDVSWANALGGLLVAGAVVLFARLDSAALRPTHFRPFWATVYVVNLGWQLVLSNLRLALEILTPGLGTHTAIVAVRLRGGSDAVVNLVANSITLTPGTMTIDVVRHDPGREPGGGAPGVTMYVHGIYSKDVEAVRHGVLRLEALALRAFGSDEEYRLAESDVEDHEAATASPRASSDTAPGGPT